MDLAAAKPILSSLLVRLPPISERRYMGSCLGIVKELMLSSGETLEELQIMCASFPTEFLNFSPMVQLRKLKISGENEFSLPQLLGILRSIDYPKMLPSLSTVSRIVRYSSERLLNPLGNDDAVAGIMHQSTTVQQLSVLADFAELTFQDLSSIFPELSSVQVFLPPSTAGPIPYGDLFAFWPQLEVLCVTEGAEASTMNFDSLFLGIDPEEVEILREMDDESLDKIHIVPTRPSLLTMLRK